MKYCHCHCENRSCFAEMFAVFLIFPGNGCFPLVENYWCHWCGLGKGCQAFGKFLWHFWIQNLLKLCICYLWDWFNIIQPLNYQGHFTSREFLLSTLYTRRAGAFFYSRDELVLMLLFIPLPTLGVGAAASHFFVKTWAEQGHNSSKFIKTLDVLILLMY